MKTRQRKMIKNWKDHDNNVSIIRQFPIGKEILGIFAYQKMGLKSPFVRKMERNLQHGLKTRLKLSLNKQIPNLPKLKMY